MSDMHEQEWRDASQPVAQLMLLFPHFGVGGEPVAPLVEALRSAFPHSAVVCAAGRPWSLDAAERVADAQWVRQQQQRFGVDAQATALAGQGNGAARALDLALMNDGLCGRVLAFSPHPLAEPPALALEHTTLHLFHAAGDSSASMGADADAALAQRNQRMRQWFDTYAALGGDATWDLANGTAQALHPALVQRLIERLRSHIPARTWAEALGQVPNLGSPRVQ